MSFHFIIVTEDNSYVEQIGGRANLAVDNYTIPRNWTSTKFTFGSGNDPFYLVFIT